MQVGEELLTLAEAVVFFGDRLLDLDYQVGRGEDLLGPVHEPGPGPLVLLVLESGAGAGAGLHDNLATVVDQLLHPVGLHADAAFLVLDLPRNSHHCSHAVSFSSSCPGTL